MSIEELQEYIAECTEQTVLIFSNYSDAFLGLSHDNRAVYSYTKIFGCLTKEGMSEEEAIEYIDYNVLGSLTDDNIMPVVVMDAVL